MIAPFIRPFSKAPKCFCCAQVDDFALACPNEDMAKRLYDQIDEHLQLPSETQPPFKYLGLLKDFNGLDIAQYSDAIKLSCEKYIERVLTTHGWNKPPPAVPSKPPAPLPVDAVTSLYAHKGPPENTAEHAALVEKYGFAYRTLLGELLYAYVTCRPDIGYATITLSKFSTCPHDHHFAMLKKVAKHLRATKDWGIIYRRSQPDTSLPPSNLIRSTLDADLPAFPDVDPQEPAAFLDAAHANDLRNRRSTIVYCAAEQFRTGAKRSLSLRPVPPKPNFSLPWPPQNMPDACAQSCLTLASRPRVLPSYTAITNRPSIWSTLVSLLSALVTLISSISPLEGFRRHRHGIHPWCLLIRDSPHDC